MKKKLNYLVLLLTIIFMVGCTNVEDTATSDKETNPKVAATENSHIKSEKEEAVAEIVDEPEGERKPQPEQIKKSFRDTISLKSMVVICLAIDNRT